MMAVMRKSVVCTLLLSCTLALVLPPGWCCVVGFGACRAVPPPPAEQAGDDEEAACCCCGDCADRPRPAEPTPCCPPVRPPSERCCYDRDPTAPDKPVLPRVELPPAGFVFVAEAAPVVTSEPSDPTHLHPPRPFHVLQCVWLC
jgi:hypothetical protein